MSSSSALSSSSTPSEESTWEEARSPRRPVPFSDSGEIRRAIAVAADLLLRRRLHPRVKGEQLDLPDIPVASLASLFAVATVAVLYRRSASSPACFPATPRCVTMSLR